MIIQENDIKLKELKLIITATIYRWFNTPSVTFILRGKSQEEHTKAT